ncbi:MAG: HD domain-containing protein [Treponema sp.]|nr:HD domain-containing protein [Treponema sp.]
MNDDIRRALCENYCEPVRDMLWGHIYLTPALAAITQSAPFMRLHRIMQLGPTFMVYPGATHTRASHSIGVYHLARRLLCHLAGQGADSWLSAEGVKSFLCAALLHDAGHFPYTHSLKELPLKDHESLTASLIVSEPLKSLISAAGGDPYMAAAIVDTQAESGGGSGGSADGEVLFYRRLLSGALDPDKLDYLSRDGRYCGVPYGAQDVDFIFSRLQPDRERGVVIDSRGIPAVESLLFAKYLMYRAVYWHKAVRSATAMIKKALFAALESRAIAPEELYNLDDQGLFARAAARACPLFSLAESVKNGRFFTLAAEIPFNEHAHGDALRLSARPRMEESLAQALSPCLGTALRADELIIDVGEPVSFESGLFVTDENCLFSEGSSVFKGSFPDAFATSLRTIRIFVEPGFERDIEKSREGILHTAEKWLTLL